MYLQFSLLNQILKKLAALAVIAVLVLFPVSAAFAQEVPTEPEAPTETATTTEEVPTEPTPTVETTEEPAPTEPVQTDGGDGADGGAADSGTDGAAAGEGGDGGGTTSSEDDAGTTEGGDGGDTGTEGGETGGTEASNENTENTTIGTGDASADGTITNYIDLSILNTLATEAGYDGPLYVAYIYWDSTSGTYKASTPEAQEKLDKALEDGVVDPYEYLDIISPEEDVTASTTNDAIVGNEANITAETGQNTANYNQNVSINTGNATAVANVLNVVNTNIFDSEGFFLFLDNLGGDGVYGDLDFRDYDFFDPANVQKTTDTRESLLQNPITAICPSCGGAGDLTINLNQSAEITNDIVVRSGTGINAALYNSGNVDINTGDAYAVANVINIANTNIVDSNYLLLTFNNFGDYSGNIVFPPADEFLDMFAMGGNTTPQEVNIQNTNTTSVDNNTDVTGATGDNTALSGGDSSIDTGNASANTNTLNQLNSNLFGGSSFSILVKVHGSWSGDVIGVPDGLEWREAADGIELFYDSEGGNQPGGYDAINIISNNSTMIANNIEVVALTGENKITGAGGDASITTGDAYAAANVINVANTNVIGKNWLMAVINIFGDWDGSIVFGMPNLWVGAKADMDSPKPGPGASLTYNFTVMNTGDAPAVNTCLRSRFDHRYLTLEVLSPITDRQIRSGEIEYCIGTVGAGEVYEFSRRAWVTNDLPYGTTFISNDIEVLAASGEEYLDDNNEIVTFEVWRESEVTVSSGTRITYEPSPELTITKSHSSPFGVRASSTVNYRILIKNEGPGSAYNAILIDTLSNENGILYREKWNLGEIYPGEEIEVMYTTFFNDASDSGMYTNSAYVKALGGYHTFAYGRNADSEEVKSSVLVLPALKIYSPVEVVEVIEESVKTIEADTDDAEEVIEPAEVGGVEEGPPLAVLRVLGPLYSHPVYTQHPIYVNSPQFASLFLHPLFSEEVWESPLDHPVFTQHPVYIKRTVLARIIRRADDSLYTSWLETLASSVIISAIKWPFDQVTVVSAFEDAQKPPDEEKEKLLVLLAMSIFIMDRRRKENISTN